MGAIQDDSNKYLFMNISGGKLSYTTTPDDPAGEEIHYEDSQTGEDKITHKIRLKGYMGKITKLEYKEAKFGDFFNMYIKDDSLEETAVIQFPTSKLNFSSVYFQLINLLTNVNFEENTIIEVWKNEKPGKDGKVYSNNYLSLTQNGEKIIGRFYKDNNEGQPDAEKKTVAGKTKWDYSPIEDYWYDVVQNELIPKLEGITGYSSAKKAEKNVTAKVEGSSQNFVPKVKEKTVEEKPIVEEEEEEMPF